MKKILTAIMMVCFAVGCCNNDESSFNIAEGSSIDGLHAPWDGLDDDTVFRCFCDKDYFYFYYEVTDNSLTLTVPFVKERDVDPEDRVEVFFSPREEMDIYYCAEIDPIGHIMDYKAKYYRDFDYDWNFATMEVLTKVEEGKYIVSGKVAKSELTELGLDLGHFYMGVFRADFKEDGAVVWYSAIPTEDESPDFHKSNVLFTASMR